MRVAQVAQGCARHCQRFVPGGFAEYLHDVVRIHHELTALRGARTANQRHGQALRMPRVIESVAALDAQARVVGRAVAALDVEDAVVLDMILELTAHAAVWTERFDGLIGHGHRHFARRHQSPGRAGLHALAAADAGGGTHGIVHVEHDLGVLAAEGEADHVVDLLVAAGAQAARALDAGVEIDGDTGVREIGGDTGPRREARLADVQARRPIIDLVMACVFLLRHVRLQQLDHHLLCLARARAVGRHLHAGLRRAAAGGGEDALALDLDHAGAAVAHRIEPGLVAEAGDFDAFVIRYLENGLGAQPRDFAAVEREGDRRCFELRAFGAGDRVHRLSSGNFVRKVLHDTIHRIRRRLAQAADRGVAHHLR